MKCCLSYRPELTNWPSGTRKQTKQDNRKRARLLEFLQCLCGDQTFLEGAILSAAGDPDIAGTQAVSQFRQYAQFIIAPVDHAAGQDIGYPALAARSSAIARISEALAGTLSNSKASRKAGDQRRIAA